MDEPNSKNSLNPDKWLANGAMALVEIGNIEGIIPFVDKSFTSIEETDQYYYKYTKLKRFSIRGP